MSDGRPIPPPKPMHYAHTRPWRPDAEMNIDPHQMKGMNSFQSPPLQHSLSSNMDMTGAPPAYYQTTSSTEIQQANTPRSNGISSQPDVPTASYANHSSLTTPTRRLISPKIFP